MDQSWRRLGDTPRPHPWCLPGVSPSSSHVQAATAALTPGLASGSLPLLPRSRSAIPLHTLWNRPPFCPFGHPPPPRWGQSCDDLFLQRGVLCRGHTSVSHATRVFVHCCPLKWLVVWFSYDNLLPVNCLCFGAVENPVSLPSSIWCIPISRHGD